MALNVAEKPSVAKKISEILAENKFDKLTSKSKFNPVFGFDYEINKKNYLMNFTSVSGHLMNADFKSKSTKWELNEIQELFNTKIIKFTKGNFLLIEENLKIYGKKSDLLILWLDCDREGENIAFEVIDVVKSVNPKIQILRAKFSALTPNDIKFSISNLVEPNKNISDGVDLRQKIDLLIGSAFTRMQTLAFKNILSRSNQNSLISYGPCQFPTLNFVKERSDKIQNFKKEKFYFVELILKIDDTNNLKFNWKRVRIFDKDVATTIHEKILSKPTAEVIDVTNNPKIKYRPVPLNTIEMQKIVSRQLKISPHLTMDVAEKLYQKGYISYPRTETKKYTNTEIPFLKKILLELGKGSDYDWTKYAHDLSQKNFHMPRDGLLDDKSHPPIHPVKFVPRQNLTDLELIIYEFLVRHFLAVFSENSEGNETYIEASAGEEIFYAKGVEISKKGYLEVYPYENWADNILPNFTKGQKFSVKDDNLSINLNHGLTTPPNYLTEAELISLMDKNGIGTDSTIHEHIKVIQERGYCEIKGSTLKPTMVGTNLIKAYEKIGIELYKPYLRCAMEKEITNVCEGKIDHETAFKNMKKEMKIIFDKVFKKLPDMTEYLKTLTKNTSMNTIDMNIDKHIPEVEKNCNSVIITNINIICPNCNQSNLKFAMNRTTENMFISCSGYPLCKYNCSIGNPSKVSKVDQICEKCKENQMFELEFNNKSSNKSSNNFHNRYSKSNETSSNQIKCLGKCFDYKQINKKRNSNITYRKNNKNQIDIS